MNDIPPPESSGAAAVPRPSRRVTASAIRAELKQGRVAEVVQALADLPPLKRAELFVQMKPAEQKAILIAAPPELSAAILADSDSARVAEAVASMEAATLAPALALTAPDHLADLLLRLPEPDSGRLLQQVHPALQSEVRPLLAFDPDTAGGMMTPRVLSVPEMVMVGKALEILRAAPR